MWALMVELADAENLLRGGEAAALHDGEKDAQLTDVDIGKAHGCNFKRRLLGPSSGFRRRCRQDGVMLLARGGVGDEGPLQRRDCLTEIIASGASDRRRSSAWRASSQWV